MKLKTYQTYLSLALLICSTHIACQENLSGDLDSLPHFSNQVALENWIATHKDNENEYHPYDSYDVEYVASSAAGTDSAGTVSSDSTRDSVSNENITNNQESNVDEGGIVKNIGDYLIVLRQGRIYSVKVASQGETTLVDSIAIASDEFLKDSVWYDELLVHQSQIVTIGYRYLNEGVYTSKQRWIYGATEINTFTLSADGQIQREATHFVESNDYYDSSNSASRLVNGSLVLYMPHHIQSYVWDETRNENREVIDLPHSIHYNGEGQFTIGNPLITAQEIAYHQNNFGVQLHTLVHCPVQLMADQGPLQCESQGFLSSWGREFYVSATHAFVYSNHHVYAMRLDHDMWVGTHQVNGTPQDQFAFRQIDDQLQMAVQVENERTDTDGGNGLEVLQLNLEDFDGSGLQELEDIARQSVNTQSSYVDFQRYMEHKYIALTSQWSDQNISTKVFVHDLQENQTEIIEIDGSASRLEVMNGLGLFVVTAQQDDLHVSIIRIDDQVTRVEGPDLSNMSEGESRSHGFFYKGDADGGLFALPVITTRSYDDYLDEESDFEYNHGYNTQSNMMFFTVDAQGHSQALGLINSEDQTQVSCESSCVDWYGNTRPIFLKDRIYALMGSEIKEVALDEGQMNQMGDRVLLDF